MSTSSLRRHGLHTTQQPVSVPVPRLSREELEELVLKLRGRIFELEVGAGGPSPGQVRELVAEIERRGALALERHKENTRLQAELEASKTEAAKLQAEVAALRKSGKK